MKKKIKINTGLYRFSRPLVKIFMKVFYHPKFIGTENIPEKDKVILAGTHINNLDCFMLMSSTKRSIHFLAKKELWAFPQGIIFANMGLIPVDRSIKDSTPLNIAKDYLEQNGIIGIFPEGTTEKGRGMLPFKIGTVKLAKEANTQIVPFVIKGEYKIFGHNLKIVFGKPIMINDNDLTKANNSFQEIIKSMREEM